ncbi:MAG: potassium channel family protein [Prochlorothrix sp.]
MQSPSPPRILVCGLGRTGQRIFHLLRQQGAQVQGLHSEALAGEPDILVGDPRSAQTLLAAGIQHLETLVLTFGDDTLNLAILMQARVLNPQVRVITRLFNSSLGERLDFSLLDHTTLSVSALAAPVFAFAALGDRAIGQLQLFHQTWPIHEEKISPEHPWCGKKLAELWDDRTRMLIYYITPQDPVDLITAIRQKRVLQPGDRLIIATFPRRQRYKWPWYLHFNKTLHKLQRLQRYGRSAVGVTIALLLCVAIATVTYLYFSHQVTVADALYFSVGMITGAGGNEFVVEQAPVLVKLFTALMMLVGAAVVGIFYALINDFVLGTHFQRLWDVTQVPPRHHFIICGLGGVGIKTAQLLQRQGYEVVVIEQDPHNRFLRTARDCKIPIIHGDGGLPATLEAANLKTAAALLVVTSNDTTNLEVALTAKGVNPEVPIVVRYQDGEVATMAQQVFDFEAVLSPTDLAAPSFAAVALGGRILGNGMTGNMLWVAIATIITPNHAFCGVSVEVMATELDCVPLYLETATATVHGWSLLSTQLQTGDVLYLTLPVQQVHRLWRSRNIPVDPVDRADLPCPSPMVL